MSNIREPGGTVPAAARPAGTSSVGTFTAKPSSWMLRMQGMTPGTVRSRLRLWLASALKERDPVATAALRSVLAAIDNAEAVDLPPAARPMGGPIAAAVVGLGRGDVPRRQLTAADVAQIVQAEIEERENAALQYDAAGRADRAVRLRAEAAVIRQHLPSNAEGGR